MLKTLFKTFGRKFIALYIITTIMGISATGFMIYATIQWYGWHGPLIFMTLMALVTTWLYYVMAQQFDKEQ